MNIHIALTCIRLFLCIPIILLKPSWKKVPGKPKKYNLLEWHTAASDKQKSINDKIFCVWNGDSMCIPALPTAVAELNTNISNVEENIDEALQLLHETKAMVPKSKLKEGILEVEKQMKLSGDLIATFRMTTGGANLGAKMSFVESGGPSTLLRLPTRRAPSEKVKTFTVSVPPKDTNDDPAPTQLTYTEETTAMENKPVPLQFSFQYQGQSQHPHCKA